VNEEHICFKKSYHGPRGEAEGERGEIKCNNLFQKGCSLEIRQDLVDCEVHICTEDVLNLFSDNFDKTNLKDGFINWLYESDVIEDRIRVYEVK
jgi:hypothetical protein